MKKIIVFIIVLTSNFTWAQKDISFDLFGGVDYNELQPENSSIDVSPRFSPFGGVGINIPAKNKQNFLQAGVMYYMKSSKDLFHIKYRSTGISVLAKYYLSLSQNIWINLGGQYSVPIESYVLNGAVKDFTNIYKSYFSLNAGLRFQLQKNLSAEVSYEYPFGNSHLKAFPNIKMGVVITFDKELFKKQSKENNKEKSVKLIHDLKNTALLVSLPSYKYRINKCLEAGNTEMVKRLEEERYRKNIELMTAFKTYFDFCPVYFFYNHDAHKIKNRDFENIFLNESLENDPNIKFNKSEFLVGRLGYSNLDTTQNASYTDVYKNGFNIAEGYTVSYQSESNFSNYGFTMVNQNFEFLDSPFPSHTRGYFLFTRRSPANLVKRLNEKMHKFYQESRK